MSIRNRWLRRIVKETERETAGMGGQKGGKEKKRESRDAAMESRFSFSSPSATVSARIPVYGRGMLRGRKDKKGGDRREEDEEQKKRR